MSNILAQETYFLVCYDQAQIQVSKYAAGGQLTPTPEDIPEPSHGRVSAEKFRSVYVVKGVSSLLTDLFLKRLSESCNQGSISTAATD